MSRIRSYSGLPCPILFALLAASRNPSRNWRVALVFRDGFRDDLVVDGGAAYMSMSEVLCTDVRGPLHSRCMATAR